jgi:multiple sugar transport system substrate-binding protein
VLKTTTTKRLAFVAATATMVAALAACSGGDGGSTDTSSSGKALTDVKVWDPYPQNDDSSDWAKYLQTCAPEGTTITRTTAATADLLNNLTSAVKEGNAPDVVILDNPAVPDAASSGLLATAEEVGIDTSGFDANLAGPGTVDGVSYGVPIGANTLGLYYNKEILADAGVDPASITDWATLNDALAKVTAKGHSGITFSGITGEEGVFQFLPWFWGAGADLTKLDSSEAEQALALWTDWVNKGLAPNSVLSNTQGTSWDEFMTGEYAFAENGSWFKSAADEAGYKSIQVPGFNGGVAPAPTGGEFITIPVQKDTSRYATSAKIVDCLSTGDTGATALGYVAPTADGQAAQLAADPSLQFWIDAVGDAKPRTADNLGVSYGVISEQLYTAIQNALS